MGAVKIIKRKYLNHKYTIKLIGKNSFDISAVQVNFTNFKIPWYSRRDLICDHPNKGQCIFSIHRHD
jgi:hypothetical protein